MIFELRALVTFWLIMVGFVLTAAAFAGGPSWLAWSGPASIASVAIWNVISGQIRLSADHLKASASCMRLALPLAVVGFIGLALVGSGPGAGFVAGIALLLVILAFVIVAAFRITVMMAKSAVPMTFNIIFRGKRDYYRAVMATAKGHWEESLAALSRYEQQHPSDPVALAQEAWVLVQMGRHEEALAAVERSLAVQETGDGLCVRGGILLAVGAGEEAVEHIERSLKLNPKMWYGKVLLGRALLSVRRLDDAVVALRSADKPLKFSQSPLALGDAYRLLGMPGAASKAYTEAARRGSRDAASDILPSEAVLSCALVRVGKLNEAEKRIRSVLARDGCSTTALYAQALLSLRQGDSTGVEVTLERMLAVSPNEVVSTLTDADFTPLLADDPFRRLLGRALEKRERVLQRVRDR